MSAPTFDSKFIICLSSITSTLSRSISVSLRISSVTSCSSWIVMSRYAGLISLSIRKYLSTTLARTSKTVFAPIEFCTFSHFDFSPTNCTLIIGITSSTLGKIVTLLSSFGASCSNVITWFTSLFGFTPFSLNTKP